MCYINNSYPLVKKEYYSSSKSCKKLEFNGLYPHKTIYEFIHTLEDELFVFCGKIVGLFKVDQWFYPVCHYGAFLNIVAGSYYCVYRHLTVFSATSKCKLQVAFQDLTFAALFPMLDNLIEGIDCINNNGSSIALSTHGEKVLTDNIVLLLVKKIQRVDELSDDAVEALRMIDDIELIKQFNLDGNNFTPAKSMFQTPSADLPSHVGKIGTISSLSK
ncbi:hypothetical protein P8452_65875 [Trifolium repens]|nr:hypothetical protein P8452_65875 [Trifolium repens]